MPQLDKATRSVLIAGAAAAAVFVIFIFLINGWVGHSLEQAQDQIGPAAQLPKPKDLPQRPVNLDSAARQEAQDMRNEAAVGKKTSRVESPVGQKEAPILNKLLNE